MSIREEGSDPYQDQRRANTQYGKGTLNLYPIMDNNTSPAVGQIGGKRQLGLTERQSPPPATSEEQFNRNHQVNYSFGQQPFKDFHQSQQNKAVESGASSIRKIAPHSSNSPATFRQIDGNGQAISQQLSNEFMNSHQQKSIVSMNSVMNEIQQNPAEGGFSNIFAQSLQDSQTKSGTQYPKSPMTGNLGKNLMQQAPQNVQMSQTQSSMKFVTTAQQIQSVEKLVLDGLLESADRASQHSVEAERLGLRRSQGGVYQNMNASKDAKDQIKGRTKLNAKTGNQISQAYQRQATLVPQEIHNQMLEKGFRPSSKHDGHFEYDSDTIERYEMISNEFDYEEVRKGTDFGIKQYKDCIYRGQLNHARQREGLGVLVYQNGRVYEGEWLKNKRHGRGFEVFSNGNSFNGSYENGKANGKGVYQWKNGEVYDGEWMNGIKHGYGVWKGTNGESYIGQWVSSRAQGYGVHVFANGDKYEGEWHQCLREGNGSDFFANGDCFVGQYSRGKPEGFGQYKWKNGSSYTGQFVNGLKHGHGKWKKKQADEFGNTKCNSYEGMYENDKKHGLGVFEWESGNRYEGNYLDDERHGYGVMKWTDESVYMGLWDQGIQHGIGVMIFPDGVKRAGIFEENVFKESLKRKEQINPFRDQLADDCIQILEELLAQKEQSKADLFGPLNKSKAELVQKDFANLDLNLDSSIRILRETSEGRKGEGKLSGSHMNLALETISDNASVINKRMYDADKEDLNQTMQKQNSMRDSMASSKRRNQQLQGDLGLPPVPSTAAPRPNIGRTIEVQTDLSMVTMEQYSQGYNSKAFMNKTHEFKKGDNQNADKNSYELLSPKIRFQNDLSPHLNSLNNSNKDFQNVLSKPQFQDTKHQQEILGGDNPNEDTESEWNRNNSSMMVHKPNLMNGTQNSLGPLKKSSLANQQRKKINVKKSSTVDKRRQTSIENSLVRSRGKNQTNNFATPYAAQNSQNKLKLQKPLPFTNPRENKFVDRNLVQNRQGQRLERSVPQQRSNDNRQFGGAVSGDFVIPGPQEVSNQRAFNFISEHKKPPQKMFQSQYGASRFGGGMSIPHTIHPDNHRNQIQNHINTNNSSIMQQYPLMDTPAQNRNYSFPNSEQPHSLDISRLENVGENQLPLPRIYQMGGNQDTPVVHQNLVQRNQFVQQRADQPQHVAMRQYFGGFNAYVNQNRENILTPSPKRESDASNFDRSNHQSSVLHPRHTQLSQNEMNIKDIEQIPVERMFGDEYGQDARRGAKELLFFGGKFQSKDAGREGLDNYRGKTSTSSQRTLRYNDFELVQKLAQDDPAFEVHMDEEDDKDSNHGDSKVGRQSVAYPDINQQRLYESKQGSQTLKVKSYQKQQHRESLPQMGLHESIQQQRQRDDRERKQLNSNDTQLANHTRNLNASQEEQNHRGQQVILPNNRIMRSLPPASSSKISVKQGISMIGIGGVDQLSSVGRIIPVGKLKISPKIDGVNKIFEGKKKHSNSNSRRRFDFVGPYAQNLKRPKVNEARGTQKIALNNHLASLQRQQLSSKNHQAVYPFNSLDFPRKKSSLIENGIVYPQSFDGQTEDRGEKHTNRFNSHGDLDYQGGNFVIQHQALINQQHESLSQMNHEHNFKHKRVWVPYNKKLKLKGMQQTMTNGQGNFTSQMRSAGSGNPLLNSN